MISIIECEMCKEERESHENTIVGLSYKFIGVNMIDFNCTFAKAYVPYNSTEQSILNNTGDIARIQLTWVYNDI